MEIETEVFRLLRDMHRLIEPHKDQKEKGNFTELDKETSLFVENGCLFAQYMLKLNEQQGLFPDLNIIALEGLQHLESPAAKLFNWNLICRELENNNSGIQIENKSLLVAGDTAYISQLLSQIRALDRTVLRTPTETPRSKQAVGQGGSMKASGRSNSNIKKKSEVDKHIEAQKKGTKGKKKKIDEPAEGSMDINAIDPQKPLIETDSPLEFLLVSVSKAFKILPKQAAALLTNNNLYMQHACIKGLKGEFGPIVQLMNDVFNNCRRLCNHAVNNWAQKDGHPSQGKLLLDTYKLGFFSQSELVAEATCKLFVKVYQEFQAREKLDDFGKWFIAKNETTKAGGGGGLEGAMFAFKHQPAIVESFTYLCLQTFKGKFNEFWPMAKQDYIKSKQAQYIFLSDTLSSFYAHSPQETLQELINPNLTECVKNCQNGSLDLKVVSIAMLCEIWLLEPQILVQNTQVVQQRDEEGDKQKVTETLAEISLRNLAKAAKDKTRNLRVTALGQMFRMLSYFAQERNPMAPLFYKQLTFLLIETHEDDVTRELIMSNFKELFATIPSLPIGIIIEPLVRCIAENEGNTYHVNVFDFDFFILLCKHPKLQFNPYGLQIMDLMAKLYLQHGLWASSALMPLMILSTRYLEEAECQDFLGKFTSLALSSFLSLKKPFELVVKGQELNLPLADVNKNDSNSIRKIKRFNVVTLVKKVVLELKISEEFNEQVKEQILHTNRRYKEYYGTMCRGLVHLLEIWEPKPKKIAQEYIKTKDEEDRIAAEQEAIRLKKLAAEEEKAKIQARYYTDAIKPIEEEPKEPSIMPSESQNSQAVVKFQKKKRDVLLVAWIHQGPKNDIERKAWKELEKIRDKRHARVKAAREKRKQEKEDYKTLNKQVREEILRRKVELGVERGEEVPQELIVYEPNTDKRGQSLPPGGMPRDVHPRDLKLKLLDLENEEEQRDADGVALVIQKYSKLLKFLFNKYSMTRSKYQKAQNFEFYSGNTLNISEIAKLLREHQTPIPNDVLNTLIRLLNQKVYKQLNFKAMTFDVFCQLVPQIAFYRYSNLLEDQIQHKPGEASNVLYRNPGTLTQQLFTDWRTASQQKGQSTVIYDDPDILSTAVDDKLLRELNNKLKENPEYILPEQFFKVQEKEQVFHYRLPECLPLGEEVKIGVEVLDEIVNELFGFHFIEPIAEYKTVAKAKPKIKQLAPPVQSYLDFKTRQKKFVLANPIYQSQPNMKTMKSLEQDSDYLQMQELRYKKPSLNPAVKIAAYNLGNTQQVQECAETLEELLQAVEKGLDHVPERKLLGISVKNNKALLMREEYEKMGVERERKRNDLRLERKRALEEQLKTMREVREGDIETPTTRNRRLKEEKQQRLEMQRQAREQVLARKEELKEIRMKQREEQDEARREQEEAMKEKMDQRIKEQKEFLKNQKITLRKDFKKKVNEREETEKKKKEFEQWQKEKFDKQKKKMEEYFKDHKEQSKQEQEESKKISEFLGSPDMHVIFLNYDKSLQYLFDFYSKQETKKITREISKDLSSVSFAEFVRFGYQTSITPSILSTEEMVIIYRVVLRERKENYDKEVRDLQPTYNQMTYEEFKKALIRISIIGAQALGGKKAENLVKRSGSEVSRRSLSQKATEEIGQKPPSRRSSLRSAREIKEGTNQEDEYQMLPKKTLDRKAQRDLAKQKEKFQKMFNTKIEDKRLAKNFDVSKISHKTVEALLKFIGVEQQATHKRLDMTLNKQRIEEQGAKPNRVKKQRYVPEKAKEEEDDLEREEESQEKEEVIEAEGVEEAAA